MSERGHAGRGRCLEAAADNVAVLNEVVLQREWPREKGRPSATPKAEPYLRCFKRPDGTAARMCKEEQPGRPLDALLLGCDDLSARLRGRGRERMRCRAGVVASERNAD